MRQSLINVLLCAKLGQTSYIALFEFVHIAELQQLLQAFPREAKSHT